MILTTKAEFLAKQERARQIANCQAQARTFARASILGPVSSRQVWNVATKYNATRKNTQPPIAVVVQVYAGDVAVRSYTADGGVPHRHKVIYKLRVFPHGANLCELDPLSPYSGKPKAFFPEPQRLPGDR